jgi:hypothetical protein
MNNPTPLSDAEVEERNARARELGIMEPGEEDGPYGSLAAAQAAGMPVELPDAGSSRQTAREFVGSTQFGDRIPTPTHLPAAPIVKLPDFRKVEGFDFFRNVLYIDGLEFEIPEVDVLAMKKYAVDLALDYVVKQLADALVLFGVPPALAQQTAESVKEGASHGAGEATEGVQEVRESGHQPEGTDEV